MPKQNCIRKIELEKCKCTLVVPEWKSAPYWPLFVNNDANFKGYVRGVVKLKNLDAVCKGRGKTGYLEKRDMSLILFYLNRI